MKIVKNKEETSHFYARRRSIMHGIITYIKHCLKLIPRLDFLFHSLGKAAFTFEYERVKKIW